MFKAVIVLAAPTNFFLHLNCFRIIFSSLNNLEKPDELSIKSLNKKFSALLEAPIKASPPSVPKYTEENL